MSARTLRAAGVASAAGMLLAILANVAVDCDAFLSSDALDCGPWGPLIDVGHAAAAIGACVVCVGLVGTTSLPSMGRAAAAVGSALMTAIGALHLSSLVDLWSHGALFQPLVVLWALAGIWIGLQVVGRKPFDLVSIVGLALAVTAVLWALSRSDSSGDHSASDDALRLAGGGFFALGFPLWIAWVADVGPHPRHPIRYSAHPLAANAQRLAILGGSALATVVFIVPFWFLATFRPILGDPSWSVHVTNAANEPLSVAVFADHRPVQIGPGSTADLQMGFEPQALTVTALDRSQVRVFCKAMSAREVLHARLRITVLRQPETCAAP
jgi:hypothetical protein